MTTLKKLTITVLAWAVALGVSFPILWMAVTAFKTELDALQFPPTILFRPTLQNFMAFNGSVPILRPILNSVVEAGGGTALCFLFAFPAAYSLAFHCGRARNAILLGMLTTRFMPGIGIMLPMYLIFKALGLIDTQLGLILAFALTNLPIVIWMLYSYMREIPREILECSRLDGATERQALVSVLLPLCLPGVGSTALLSIILCWNEAFWSIQLTSFESAPLGAYVATLSSDLQWGQLSAVSLLAVGPILIVGWLTQRTFVRGLTFGAVR